MIKDKDGFFTSTLVDEAGKELEKSQPAEKPEKPEKPPKPSKKQPQIAKTNESSATNNYFIITNETENVPTLSEYQSSLRENKLKGQPEKPPKAKPSRKPVENKENEEKGKESTDTKKDKIKKPEKKKQNEEKKKPPHQAAVKDVPFWQNDTFKPLVYVFAFVALISVLYLTLN